MPDFLVANLPWSSLGLALLLSLAISALGFRRVDWFISLGYGFSIAAEAAFFALLYRNVLSPWLVAQLLLLLAYGLRLGLYLVSRERSPSFARELAASKERSAHITQPIKFAIWISVAALYVAMASPLLFNLTGTPGATLPVGAIIMLVGLVLEAAADAQKFRIKARDPKRFVSTGLFSIVRCPNYFGEIIFWFGGFIAGIGAYGSLAHWLIAAVGFVCIELIMLGSARRLEIKQAERYDGDPAYLDYVRRVPILFPLLPLYSLRHLKIYLG
ncbi:MAG: DUF1295 domain-containing protein [Devosia sp.]